MKRLRANRRAGRVRTPAPVNPPNDCLHCGVCCFSQLETYVRVSGDDWKRLGEAAETVAHFIGNRAYMKMTGQHCAALAIREIPGAGSEFFCTIYERRPQVCRDLARGSAECEGERAAKAARVLAQDYPHEGRVRHGDPSGWIAAPSR